MKLLPWFLLIILFPPAAVLAQPAPARPPVMLPGRVAPLANARNDRGPVESAFALPGMTLVLKASPAQQADLEQLTAAQQDPSSPSFHQWLTPEQYAGRFGASAADVAQITAWLKSQGFTVTNTGAQPHLHFVSGDGGAGAKRISYRDSPLQRQRRDAFRQCHQPVNPGIAGGGGGGHRGAPRFSSQTAAAEAATRADQRRRHTPPGAGRCCRHLRHRAALCGERGRHRAEHRSGGAVGYRSFRYSVLSAGV